MAPPMGKIAVAYQCSVCGTKVEVTVVPNSEPKIKWACGHDGKVVNAMLSGTLVRVAGKRGAL